MDFNSTVLGIVKKKIIMVCFTINKILNILFHGINIYIFSCNMIIFMKIIII